MKDPLSRTTPARSNPGGALVFGPTLQAGPAPPVVAVPTGRESKVVVAVSETASSIPSAAVRLCTPAEESRRNHQQHRSAPGRSEYSYARHVHAGTLSECACSTRAPMEVPRSACRQPTPGRVQEPANAAGSLLARGPPVTSFGGLDAGHPESSLRHQVHRVLRRTDCCRCRRDPTGETAGPPDATGLRTLVSHSHQVGLRSKVLRPPSSEDAVTLEYCWCRGVRFCILNTPTPLALPARVRVRPSGVHFCFIRWVPHMQRDPTPGTTATPSRSHQDQCHTKLIVCHQGVG